MALQDPVLSLNASGADMFKLPFQCMKELEFCPLDTDGPMNSLLSFLFFQGLNIFLIKLVEVIIDPHVVVRNNIERSCVPFTQFPQ